MGMLQSQIKSRQNQTINQQLKSKVRKGENHLEKKRKAVRAQSRSSNLKNKEHIVTMITMMMNNRNTKVNNP